METFQVTRAPSAAFCYPGRDNRREFGATGGLRGSGYFNAAAVARQRDHRPAGSTLAHHTIFYLLLLALGNDTRCLFAISPTPPRR